ncbi:LysR family transcriptional regulator [Ferviditalea candida]|uniref:LysR substrate-binding domain-containing protein n=1 Tax=Ferviditalea candida TaxID=3108399 RepID=A0ABU5ZJC8_9BACL|nr:LysR substrate-binding domain-containing protein [Paenibacillaceae bacterium T2]
MEFRLLKYFIEVCEELHFTRAAEKLGISQPTLSHQIHLLEDIMNTKLFQRSGKKVYITQAGKILLEHSKRIFYEFEQAHAEIKELQGLSRGRLAVGCSGNHILTSSVMKFHEQYPGIEISIMDLSTEETIDKLFNNQLDIGVIFLTKEDERLEFIPLFKEEFLLVVSTEHELAGLDSIPFDGLRSIPLALIPDKFLIRQFIDQYCNEIGIKLSVKLELSSLESLRHMVNVNTVATILTKSYLSNLKDPTIKSISIVDPIPQKTVGLVYRKDAFIDSTMKMFVKHLVEHFETYDCQYI